MCALFWSWKEQEQPWDLNSSYCYCYYLLLLRLYHCVLVGCQYGGSLNKAQGTIQIIKNQMEFKNLTPLQKGYARLHVQWCSVLKVVPICFHRKFDPNVYLSLTCVIFFSCGQFPEESGIDWLSSLYVFCFFCVSFYPVLVSWWYGSNRRIFFP